MNARWPYLVHSESHSWRLAVSGLVGLAASLAAGLARAQAPAPAVSPAAAEVPAQPATPDGADPAPAVAPLPAPPPPRAGDAPPPLAESPLVRPKIDLSVPEATPSVVRKMHNHDGFYLRANVGAAWSTAFVATDAENNPNYTVNGAGLSFDLLVGGTPSPSLSLGGALMLRTISDPEVHLDGGADAGSGNGGLFMIGPFVDGFPMSNGGLHLGGLLGLAGARTERQGSADDFSGRGLGVAAWVGQGFWVGKEASLGFVLKFDAAFLRDNSGPVALADTMYGGSLLFSVLYH